MKFTFKLSKEKRFQKNTKKVKDKEIKIFNKKINQNYFIFVTVKATQ